MKFQTLYSNTLAQAGTEYRVPFCTVYVVKWDNQTHGFSAFSGLLLPDLLLGLPDRLL